MLKKLLLLIGISFTIFVFGASVAEACSCLRQTSCQAYSNADVVFVGRIMKATDKDGTVTHQVQVDENFLGLEGKSLVNVNTEIQTSCGFQMEANKSYLIYASKEKKTGALWTGMCTRTTSLEYAKDDLKYLHSLKENGNKGGTIQGKVVDEESAYAEKTKKPEGVDKVYVNRKDSKEILTTEIESDGSYKLTGLEKGKYRAYLRLPEGFITDQEIGVFSDEKDIESQFEEVNDRGCTVKDYVVKTNGIISGKVLDADGIPLKKINVNLISLNEKNELNEQDYDAYTNENGFYEFKGLSPGRYLLGVGIDYFSSDREEAAYLSTYYPSSRNKEEAIIIELGKAQVLGNHIIQLFPKLKKSKVTGQIRLKKGQVVPKGSYMQAEVYVKRAGFKRASWEGRLKLDKKGNFSLEVFEETEYLIKAENIKEFEENSLTVTHSSQCVIIIAKDSVKPLQIILEKGNSNCDEDKFRESK